MRSSHPRRWNFGWEKVWMRRAAWRSLTTSQSKVFFKKFKMGTLHIFANVFRRSYLIWLKCYIPTFSVRLRGPNKKLGPKPWIVVDRICKVLSRNYNLEFKFDGPNFKDGNQEFKGSRLEFWPVILRSTPKF